MKLCLVCSRGGHLTEMRALLPALEEHDFFFITYAGESAKNLPYRIYTVESIGINLYLMFIAAIKIFQIYIKEKPDVIISTGAEIAIPACYLAKLFSKPVVFIECSAQVFTPSATGRLVYWVSDLFLVQWLQLLKKYGKKARYEGSVI